MQRQIKSCTHCRQHKVKCNAVMCKDNKCNRCEKYGLECIIDQHFKPRKGGQVEILREHIAQMEKQIQSITANAAEMRVKHDTALENRSPELTSKGEKKSTVGAKHTSDLHTTEPLSTEQTTNHKRPIDEIYKGTETNEHDKKSDRVHSAVPPLEGLHQPLNKRLKNVDSTDNLAYCVKEIEKSVAERMAAGGKLEPIRGPYKLADISLEEPVANRLYDYFMRECEPYMPMFESSSAGELYARSEFLFWAVMTVGAQGEPTSKLYMSLVGPMKELAAKKCLLETTRSSSIVQALLVLCTWPLPSEKMLEDMSSRYSSLAYSMGLQLGIHRGKFIYEFSRNQQLMPNAVKWRSRTWVQTYITQQMMSASTGIPAAMPIDHIINHALHDNEHPLPERTAVLLKISIFYSKLISIMGSSINTQDGLMEPNSRCPTLDLLKTDLNTLVPSSSIADDPVVEVAFLYARCLLNSFAFLPDTPISQQSPFLIDAFQACTRIVTVVRKMVGQKKIVEMPTFIRNPCSFAALILFRLQLLPNMPSYYVSSARESIITVHHMYRNLDPSWLSPNVPNDISRIAKLLESLNHVMITHPELLHSKRVMRHMRSHLTFSIFYEFLYIIHEAKRRNAQMNGNNVSKNEGEDNKKSKGTFVPATGNQNSNKANPSNSNTSSKVALEFEESSPDVVDDSPTEAGAMRNLIHGNNPHGNHHHHHRDYNPLPLYKDISLESYVSNTVISPNGTTLTTLTRTDGHPVDQNLHVLPVQSKNTPLKQPKNVDQGERLYPMLGPTYPSYSKPQNKPKSNNPLLTLDMKATTNKPGNNFSSVTDNFWTEVDGNEMLMKNMGSYGNSNATFLSSNQMANGNTGDNSGVQIVNDEMGSDLSNLLVGLEWMNREGDDFLGWMMPREE